MDLICYMLLPFAHHQLWIHWSTKATTTPGGFRHYPVAKIYAFQKIRFLKFRESSPPPLGNHLIQTSQWNNHLWSFPAAMVGAKKAVELPRGWSSKKTSQPRQKQNTKHLAQLVFLIQTFYSFKALISLMKKCTSEMCRTPQKNAPSGKLT